MLDHRLGGRLLVIQPGRSSRHAHREEPGHSRPSTSAVLDRAVEVQDALASQSQHRGAKIADLIIAAAAEAAALVVLHYDRDFDLIATVTGQSVEWIVEAGRVP